MLLGVFPDKVTIDIYFTDEAVVWGVGNLQISQINLDVHTYASIVSESSFMHRFKFLKITSATKLFFAVK